MIPDLLFNPDEIQEIAKALYLRYGCYVSDSFSPLITLRYYPFWIIEVNVRLVVTGDRRKTHEMDVSKPYYKIVKDSENFVLTLRSIVKAAKFELPFKISDLKYPPSHLKPVNRAEIKGELLSYFPWEQVKEDLMEDIRKKASQYISLSYEKYTIVESSFDIICKYVVYLPLYIVEEGKTKIILNGADGTCLYIRCPHRRSILAAIVAMLLIAGVLFGVSVVYLAFIYIPITLLITALWTYKQYKKGQERVMT